MPARRAAAVLLVALTVVGVCRDPAFPPQVDTHIRQLDDNLSQLDAENESPDKCARLSVFAAAERARRCPFACWPSLAPLLSHAACRFRGRPPAVGLTNIC